MFWNLPNASVRTIFDAAVIDDRVHLRTIAVPHYLGTALSNLLPLVTGICSITTVDVRGFVPGLFDSLFNHANALAVSAFCSTSKRRKFHPSLWLDNRWFARASFLAKTHRAVYGQTHSGQPGLVSRDRTARRTCAALLPGDQKHSPMETTLCET